MPVPGPHNNNNYDTTTATTNNDNNNNNNNNNTTNNNNNTREVHVRRADDLQMPREVAALEPVAHLKGAGGWLLKSGP